MQIKITGKDPGQFKNNLTAALNVACVVAMGGYLPTEQDRKEPFTSGKYWWRGGLEIHGNRFDLYPLVNDYHANIKAETETSLTLEFLYRYDRGSGKFGELLCPLLALRFSDCVTIVNE